MDYGGFYSVSCFAACAAVIFELLFIWCSIRTLRAPLDVLLAEQFKEKYGAFFDGMREAKPAVLTMLFHNIRILVLIVLLVFLAPYPMAQALSYVMLAVVGNLWDFHVWPAESRLLKIQTFIFDVAKMAGSMAYVFLAAEWTTEQFADVICNFILFVFVGAIGAGVLISVFQQVVAVYEWIRNCRKGPANMDKVIPVRSMSMSMSQNTMVTYVA